MGDQWKYHDCDRDWSDNLGAAEKVKSYERNFPGWGPGPDLSRLKGLGERGLVRWDSGAHRSIFKTPEFLLGTTG